MRYNPLSKDLYKRNRKKLVAQLEKGTMAVFHSNDIMPTNADGEMPFRQNNDLFYLSGIDQEDTTLLFYSDSITDSFKEVLFIRETNDLIKVWEGEKFSIEEAKELSGIEDVRWDNQFESFFASLTKSITTVYVNSNEHVRATTGVQTKDQRFVLWLRANFSGLKLKKVAKIQHNLRYVKEPEEIEQIKKACEITEKAFRRVLGFTKPEVMEYEIEAEIIHEFIKSGSKGHAYQPIVAAGDNACVLHYIANDKPCKDGDLILMDFGAEYGNYNSDLTRTIPANGKFTYRQKEVYNAVLAVFKYAKSQLVEGNTFKEYIENVNLFMQEELIGLELISEGEVTYQDPKRPAFRQYFMHGVSHSLGLDVHDVDNRALPFKNGMVFTCEPGIYIPEEGIGVRIENDIVINGNTPIDLMESIPIEIEEIEALMKK